MNESEEQFARSMGLFAALEKQLAINYYMWAKTQGQKEVEGGFPLLSSFRCRYSLRTFEFMQALPLDEQKLFAQARAKHSNEWASEMCGEPITEVEHELLNRYHGRSLATYPLVGNVRYGGPSEKEREIETAIARKVLHAQHSNQRFRSAVLARVIAVLGGAAEVDQFQTITHVAQGDNWKITTWIHLKGKYPMRYTQRLTNKSGLSLETSFHCWMGIMGDTYWDLITTDVAGEAIEQLVFLCARFISEGPRLLPPIQQPPSM